MHHIKSINPTHCNRYDIIIDAGKETVCVEKNKKMLVGAWIKENLQSLR
jgi:hypothetical protein